MRSIAKAVGVRESAIYAHFESKDDIFIQLHNRDFRSPLLLAMNRLQDENILNDPVGWLQGLVDYAVEEWQRPQKQQYLAFRMKADWPKQLLESDYSVDEMNEILELLSSHFKKLILVGKMRDKFSPEFVAWEFMAPLWHIRYNFFLQNLKRDALIEGALKAKKHIDYFITNNFINREGNV